jgi:hypothetical protein
MDKTVGLAVPPARWTKRRRALYAGGALTVAAAALATVVAPEGPAVAALPRAPKLQITPGINYLGVEQAQLAQILCALKDELGTHGMWTPPFCHRVAGAVLAAAQKYELSPALILGVMLNESDLDADARTPYRRGGRVYATDSGLMGIRCVFGQNGLCRNGHARGLAPAKVIEPVTNIALGAQELAYTRDRGGVERRAVLIAREADGGRVLGRKLVRCKHRTHAYWAHYNHGSFYISRGFPRHYGHRVGVLYYAFAHTLGLPDAEVTMRPLSVRDPGRAPRTADRPVEARFRALTRKIYRARGRVPLPVAPPAPMVATAAPLALASLGVEQ